MSAPELQQSAPRFATREEWLNAFVERVRKMAQ